MSAHLQERKNDTKKMKVCKFSCTLLKSYDTKSKLTSYQTNYFTPTSLSITETQLPGMLIQKAKDMTKSTTMLMIVNQIWLTRR